MSTILNALKKIENESTDQEDRPQVWPDPVFYRKALEKKRSLNKGILFLSLSVGIVIIFSFVYFYSFKDTKISSYTSDTVKKPKKIYARDDNISSDQYSAMKSAQINQPEMEPLSEKTVSKVVSLAEEKPEIDTKILFKDPVPSQDINKHEPVTKELVEFKEVKSEKETVGETTQLLKLKRDSRIDLQAIAWAPDPENSFVVINNRILRQGNSFEGIIITRIGRGDVSFKEGGKEWREEFRIR